MAETILARTKKLPPHIHSTDSLAKRFWGQGVALLPVFITACFTGYAAILRVLLICLVSTVAIEFLASKFFGKKENLRNGEAVLAAVLFSLLVPSQCPSELVILGIFITSIIRELFGGTGAYPLQPFLLARVILQICFPDTMTEPMFLAGEGNLWTLAAVGIGGVLLVNQRKGYWETPVLFIAVCFSCEILSAGRGMTPAFLSGVLFTAFFLLADPAVLPLTRKGSVLFILGAALLSFYLEPGGFSINAAMFAILWMSLVTPWLDVGFNPTPFKSKRLIKATYSLWI
jgi:Na+-translocating ferredoxin:NAD+ oxidoreductase RnfD subunit